MAGDAHQEDMEHDAERKDVKDHARTERGVGDRRRRQPAQQIVAVDPRACNVV